VRACDPRHVSDRLRIHVEPLLRDSALVLAFSGWNDAGESATSALEFLDHAIQSVPLADIDPDEFYDFVLRRPDVAIGEDGVRRIEWPGFGFRYGSVDSTRELVTGLGAEPNLRWSAFSDSVVDLCSQLGIGRVVLMGAYLADVVYSRPVQVTGSASDSEVLAKSGIVESGYEGPTGIVGVLADRLVREGASVLSLWAGLPHYIEASPNPRGSLALIQALSQHLGVVIDDGPLRKRAAEFEQKIAETVADDSELADYVKQLKRRDFAQ